MPQTLEKFSFVYLVSATLITAFENCKRRRLNSPLNFTPEVYCSQPYGPYFKNSRNVCKHVVNWQKLIPERILCLSVTNALKMSPKSDLGIQKTCFF